EHDWVCSLDQEGQRRPNGQVAEITEHLDLDSWPASTRVIVRRERAHPGAQLSFTDHDGHRFQAILTDQTGPVAALERDHRGRARVEDHIRNDKDTGCATCRSVPSSTTRSGYRSCAWRTTSSAGPNDCS